MKAAVYCAAILFLSAIGVQADEWHYAGLGGRGVFQTSAGRTHLYATVWNGGAQTDEGLLRREIASADTTWYPMGLVGLEVEEVVSMDPPDNVLLAANSNDDGRPFLYRTTNAGLEWTSYGEGLVGQLFALHPIPTDSMTMMAGGEGGRIYRSADAGSSWVEVLEAESWMGEFAGAGTLDAPLWCIGQNIFFWGGIYISTDLGRNWLLDEPVSALPQDIAVDGVDPARAYVAASDGGLLRTTNGGESWDLILGHACLDVATFPGRANWVVIWMSTIPGNTRGVWLSADGGDTWSDITGGLDLGLQARPLLVASHLPHRLWIVAGEGNGVWYRDFETSDVSDAPPNPPTLHIVAAPVPFGRQVEIRGSGLITDERTDLRLLIFDARGRLVRELTNRNGSGDGSVLWRWDGLDSKGRTVPQGVYFGRWLSASQRSGVRLIVTR